MKYKTTDYIIMILTGAYLLNLTFGIVEIIPDNIPLIGNLDEVAATLIFLQAYKQEK